MSDLDSFGPQSAAEIILACADLAPTLDFFTARLGFRVETIFPADDPKVASLSGHGLRLRLEPGGADPGWIRIPCNTPPPAADRVLMAPNGTRIELILADPPLAMAPFEPAFVLTRAVAGAGNAGRAGMLYRDLIPSRLGGRYIASHIALPHGGPVADWVHFHKIAVQMIFCRRGWARLVYQDQGEPFLFEAGDCVLQPPLIRHRVLETSAGFEVVEVSSPALHETLADHDLPLPNGGLNPARNFSGQRFHHGVASETSWTPKTGVEARETGLAQASAGRISAQVIRPAAGRFSLAAPGAELRFGFVLAGEATLARDGSHGLKENDAFVLPPGEDLVLDAPSADFQLLWVTAKTG
jgi:catechol 2,3-dioxygenase-like lactoylglutathione lyase family enzyme